VLLPSKPVSDDASAIQKAFDHFCKVDQYFRLLGPSQSLVIDLLYEDESKQQGSGKTYMTYIVAAMYSRDDVLYVLRRCGSPS
jgi:hypothetical protein